MTPFEEKLLYETIDEEIKDETLSPEERIVKREELKVQVLGVLAEQEAKKKLSEVLDFLEIPYSGTFINKYKLAEILLDEKKFAIIASKLKNKAFW
jgi:hypothetical protein